MKARILTPNGSFAEFKKPVTQEDTLSPVTYETESDIKGDKTLLSESNTEIVGAKDYNIMSAVELKSYASERGLEFKGNISKKDLMEMLLASDNSIKLSEGTDDL